MYFLEVYTSLIELFGPVIISFIFTIVIVDLIVRAFTGGY